MLQNPQTDLRTRKQLLQILCYGDFKLFVRVFFKEHCPYPFSSMHDHFFEWEMDPSRRGRREAIAAPRGHAKTTMKVLFKALHAIVYGYEKFIVVIGHSAPEAEAKVRDILNELENNELLQEVYGLLAPVKGQLGWSTKNFVAQNGIRVMAKSRGKQVRGLKHGNQRPTLIILDDCESPDKVLMEEQRYKTRQWLEKDILKLGSVGGQANIMVIGTCLHPDALLPTLLTLPGWQGYKYQAVISFAENQALWQDWRQIYTDLSNPKRQADAQAFYEANQSEMLAGTQVLWPEAESYLQLMQMIVNEGQASFQSEKQNDPFDPDRQLFHMHLAKRFRVVMGEGQIESIEWLDGSGKMIHRAQLSEIVAFHDPALGKKPGQTSEPDYAAIVVVASDTNGYLYCLDAYIEKDPLSRQIERAFQLYEKWHFDRLYLEENGFQYLLKGPYTEMNNLQTNTYIHVIGVEQHENKFKRISTLEPEITNGYLLFADTLNPRMIEQLSLFPTSYDDGPDALEGAVSQLKRRCIYNRGIQGPWPPAWMVNLNRGL